MPSSKSRCQHVYTTSHCIQCLSGSVIMIKSHSIGQFYELGNELHFSIQGCIVQDPQMRYCIGIEYKKECLFEFTSLHVPTSISVVVTAISPGT